MDATVAGTPAYWSAFAPPMPPRSSPPVWRRHCDALNSDLVRRYLNGHCGTILKTDLYDEAVGDGLFPVLSRRARHVIGIDLAASVLSAARARHPQLEALRADVRRLPFKTRRFDAV